MKTTHAHITDGPLGAEPLALHEAGAGAVVMFEGVVRPREGERSIQGLDYETYDPMAEKSLGQLAERACMRYGLIGVSVEHSRGFVPNHARSFRLRIASAHRKAALEAMDWYIDQLKQDVPIWKRPVHRRDHQETPR